MRTSQITVMTASAAVLAAVVAAPAGAQSTNSGRNYAVGSGSLAFEMTPVSDVVAQFHRTFGSNIVMKPGIDPDRRVSFTVSDLGQPGAALETVQDLANALGADWQKTFVIKRAISDDSVAAPSIDAEDPVAFRSTDVSAEHAINAVASIEGATVKFYSPIDQTVHFSSATLPASQAAREIAEQTHTVWKAYYSLGPRNTASVPMGATVIGYTGSGRPILELPIRTYVLPPKDKAPAADATANNTPTVTDQTQPDSAPDYSGYPTYGYGYDPYGYGYGYGNYGVPAYQTNGLTVMPQVPVYGAPLVFGGGF